MEGAFCVFVANGILDHATSPVFPEPWHRLRSTEVPVNAGAWLAQRQRPRRQSTRPTNAVASALLLSSLSPRVKDRAAPDQPRGL